MICPRRSSAASPERVTAPLAFRSLGFSAWDRSSSPFFQLWSRRRVCAMIEAARGRSVSMPEKQVSPRVALLHTTPVSTAPMVGAFAEWFPEAELAHITDDSLQPEVRSQGVTPAVRRRLALYAMAAEA